MKKKYLMLAAIGAIACGNVNAQTVVERPQNGSAPHRVVASAGQPLEAVIIKCSDGEDVARQLAADGYHAVAISDSVITARVPQSALQSLYADGRVRYVQLSRTATPTMVNARRATGVDRIQSGDGLDTPYTGKGVLVGVIDQGFEFKHIAFLDNKNKPRVVAVWNRKGYSKGADSEATTDIPTSGDGFDSYGHATHVTNIAAGSKIAENDYYGMAPDADIVMIPSEFSEAEVLEDVKFVSDLAKKRNQPWVINMSFGTQLGAHDGTTDFAKSIDNIIADGTGHQIVICAGNEGEYVQHAEHEFSAKDETVRLLVNPGSYGAIIDLWSQATDGKEHLNVRPFIMRGGEVDYEDDSFWKSGESLHQIAPFNQKEHWQYRVPVNNLQGGKLGLEITGQPGDSFHAWTNTGYGDFTTVSDDHSYVKGDNRYCIDEFGSSTRNSVVAAAYVTSNSWTDYKGGTEYDVRGDIGDIASFSSHGPSLTGVPKPTVAAPGSVIISAVSKYGATFNKTSTDNVQVVKRGLKSFYYRQMSGTSMSTPAVTGIVALWLQANPNLTSAQIIDIMRTTSSHDEYTGSDEWNERCGYGKIDAYAGLKEALRLGNATGITAVQGSETPLTIMKTRGEWKILFNSNESRADLSVYAANGAMVASRSYRDVLRGQEETISFNGFAKGVYVVSVKTDGNVTTKKLVVE